MLAAPAQLIALRHAMKAPGLGPGRAEDAVAGYLRDEQQLGRIAADADPLASARLLLGACLSYSFSATLLGEDSVPPPGEYVLGVVRGLRLAELSTHFHQCEAEQVQPGPEQEAACTWFAAALGSEPASRGIRHRPGIRSRIVACIPRSSLSSGSSHSMSVSVST